MTGNGQELTTCKDTMQYEMIGSSLQIKSYASAMSVNNTFNSLYSLYDMMFYSNELVVSCSMLYSASAQTVSTTSANFFNLSRLFQNFSHSFFDALHDYQ